jgi:hypothetical protein
LPAISNFSFICICATGDDNAALSAFKVAFSGSKNVDSFQKPKKTKTAGNDDKNFVAGGDSNDATVVQKRIMGRGVRTEQWTVFRMTHTPTSGSDIHQSIDNHFDGLGKMIEVKVSGSAEIQIGKNGCFCKWTLLANFRLVVDIFMSTATLYNTVGDFFCMVVHWQGSLKDSIHSNFITDEYSGHIACCVWTGPWLTKEVELRSNGNNSHTKSKSDNNNNNINNKNNNALISNYNYKNNKFETATSSRRDMAGTGKLGSSGIASERPVNYGIGHDLDSVVLKSARERLLSGSGNKSERGSSSVSRQRDRYEDHQQSVSDKISIDEDNEVDIYCSRLANNNGDGGGRDLFTNTDYTDSMLTNTLEKAIQRAVDKRMTSDQVAFAWVRSDNIRVVDARCVVSSQFSANRAGISLWLNDNIMLGCLNLFRAVPQTNISKIHFNHEFTIVNLYQGSLAGIQSLREVALRIASESGNFKVMSSKNMSIMLVNLYSDHWYLLVIYPFLKRIDCLNWFSTSAATAKLLCRLLHVYLWAHDMWDDDFKFTASEWSFCVIKAARRPIQQDGHNCGPITVRVIEYLIAGVPLTFSQDTMMRYRFKILLALKIGAFHWLDPALPPLVEADTIQKIAAVPQQVGNFVVDPAEVANRQGAREARQTLTLMMRGDDQGAAARVEGEWSQAY